MARAWSGDRVLGHGVMARAWSGDRGLGHRVMARAWSGDRGLGCASGWGTDLSCTALSVEATQP